MTDLHLSTRLSQSCTVARYLSLQDAQDRSAIADFIVERFSERYLDPIETDHAKKNGFTIMAVSCLMVESLESFRLGWKDTRNKSERAFSSFFSHWDQFATFRPISADFYRHVRCGILHQAETTGGWRIIRKGPIRNDTTINAAKFSGSLRHVLGDYASSLRTESWESETWKAFRKKMDAVCHNTKA
ncbi:TPA: hypothetical protein QEL11_002254 [Stenotrophomonas maltophilia]|nr:hypothetical protein [Stenotrophomonas maltophilia]HEL3864599.1 hypothetical protein [Stenotrophomonas maltophilia]HEL4289011.1 hypothetical protein [Stenotrophomonas maltophilia]